MNLPGPASPIATTEAQARIDEEIARYTQLICELRSRRNTLSLTCRLLPEMLETIFIHGARNYYNNPCVRTSMPSWVNVSYVCRHWRNVALGCPTLWTYHFVASLRWTRELLARSQQALLKIRINFGDPKRRDLSLKLTEKLMNHATRIQEFHLDFPDKRNSQILAKLSSRIPHLQTLKIVMRDDSSEWSSVLFHGDTPSLRTLDLSCCPVPWYAFKLSSLTTLSLHDVPIRFRQCMEEFLATLSCMPDIRCLYLDNALASAGGFLSSPAFSASQKINLPRLSRLLVAAPLSTVITFLSCVNVPLDTEVRLECYSEDDPSHDDYNPLLSILTQRFSTPENHAPPIRSSTIEFSVWGVVTLTFSASECDHDSSDSMDWNRNIPLKITAYFRRSVMVNDGNRIISEIYCSMPLMNVQSIHVIKPPFSPGFWRKILGHLPELRRIQLNHGYMPDLASVLFAGGDLSSDRDEDNISVPKLEELELYWIMFSSISDLDLLEPAITQDCLFDALATRNVPRGRLTMTRCGTDRFGEKDLYFIESNLGDYV